MVSPCERCAALGVRGAVPDEIVAPVPGPHIVSGPGNGQRDGELALGQREGRAVEQQLAGALGQIFLIDQAAPGDVARGMRLDARQKVAAHRRIDPIDGDEKIGALALAVREMRRDARRVLLDALERHAGAVILGCEGGAQRLVDDRPGAAVPGARRLAADLASLGEPDRGMDVKGERAADLEASAPHHGEKFFGDAEPGAAIGKVAGAALENDGVPARALEEMRGEKAADRTADDEGAVSPPRRAGARRAQGSLPAARATGIASPPYSGTSVRSSAIRRSSRPSRA
jgi:hypothetical protein